MAHAPGTEVADLCPSSKRLVCQLKQGVHSICMLLRDAQEAGASECDRVL